MSNLRVVLDTNVVVSAALFSQSVPRQVVNYVVRWGTVLVSTATVYEMGTIIHQPRFDRHASADSRRAFLDDLLLWAEPVEITHAITACRDPNDDKFLELALSGNATHIITGDHDLLALHPFRNIPIITPATFLLDPSLPSFP